MAEEYKSVLEKYNEDRKPRLPTAEEEAIEPVYPEEYLVGGTGKVAASGFMGLGKQTAKTAAARERIANVKIGSRAIDLQAEKALIQRLRNRGIDPFEQTVEQAARAKKQAEQVAKDRVVNKVKNTATQAGNRASTNFFGEAGNAIGNQMYQQRENEYVPTLKKGGKVSASSRADGIASRGKTKGRFV